jgi:hypothetical protein
MSRLTKIEPNCTSGKTKELLEAAKGKFGMVPNMTRVGRRAALLFAWA